ncbi:MAG: hypothetical protein EBS84_22750 [Proteobacteria bacterium]|nr:hypothetical protein [Pseudomonadota bacterium]
MEQLITELITTLRPTLRSVRKAEHLLADYWADRIALIWTTENIHRAANENKTVFTEQQAREILRNLHRHHNPQYGLRWSDLAETIQQSGLGRDIRQWELHLFIHRDVLAIDPPQKKGRS